MKKEVLPEELMNSVLGKLYDILTNGDDVVPQSEDNYLAWLSVGIPYDPKDLDFLSSGFVAEMDNITEELKELSDLAKNEENDNLDYDKLVEELLAKDSARKYQQAEQLARLCDMIPDTSGVKGSVTMNVWNPESNLTQNYKTILKFSQVADHEEDEEKLKKIKELRGKLRTEIVEKDPITDEEIIRVVDSPMKKAYDEKMIAHKNAITEYNTIIEDGLTAKTQAAVHRSAKSEDAKLIVDAAMYDWVTNGYKKIYERIAGYIAQAEERSMIALKQMYSQELESTKIFHTSSGSNFYYTSLIPGSFANSNQGWTEFVFSKSDYEKDYSFSKKKSGGGGFGSILGISFGGRGSSESKKYKGKVDASSFILKFKICQVLISRPGINMSFLTSKYWRFAENNPEFKDNMVSDGENPPNGMIPAYPTTAIFIKDLYLSFGDYTSEYFKDVNKASGKGGFSFGPFGGGGYHSEEKGKGNYRYDKKKQGIEVDGMQLVGFKCHKLPKSPDPHPDVNKWV